MYKVCIEIITMLYPLFLECFAFYFINGVFQSSNSYHFFIVLHLSEPWTMVKQSVCMAERMTENATMPKFLKVNSDSD